MARLFRCEAARWRRMLDWETAALWPVLEQARTTPDLPGLVLRNDGGDAVGWSYAARAGSDLLCGALVAPDQAGTAALIDGMLALPAARTATRVVWFAHADAPGADDLLTARGFVLDPHDYRVLPLERRAVTRTPGRAWDVRDLDATAELFRVAYPSDPQRAFAPQGHPAEWRRYTADLVLGQGCGRLLPTVSVAVPGSGGALDAVALVTDLGGGTAHLAQLAVRADLRGAGLGAALVARVSAAAAGAGFARLTLLVGVRNSAARALYQHAGFATRAVFLSAMRADAGVVRPTSSAA